MATKGFGPGFGLGYFSLVSCYFLLGLCANGFFFFFVLVVMIIGPLFEEIPFLFCHIFWAFTLGQIYLPGEEDSTSIYICFLRGLNKSRLCF